MGGNIMRMPRARTLIATAAVAAATATAGFMIASTAGASTTTTAGTLTAATGNTGTSLSITTGQSTIAAGQQDSITGTLTSNGSPEPHRVVDLYRYSDRLNKWRLVRIKQTNQAGSVKFDIRPAVTRKYALVYHGNATLAAARSGVVTVVVTGSLPRTATALSITASATSIAAGGTTKVSGVLTAGTSPVQHRLVLLRRYNPSTKQWVRVAVKRTGPQGVVFFVRAPSTTATFELVFPGGPRFAGSHSGTVTVTVAGQSGGATPAPAGSTQAAAGSTT
jgi:hypothetical protein